VDFGWEDVHPSHKLWMTGYFDLDCDFDLDVGSAVAKAMA
jgi:hypothetical protein